MQHFKYPERYASNLLSLPFIASMIIPIVILDILGEVYHRISFPLYRIPYVNRGDFIVVDRYKLKYLDMFMKISCTYCGYANGVLQYYAKIAGETEKYWCGIMHKRGVLFPHQNEFIPYDNEEEYKKFPHT